MGKKAEKGKGRTAKDRDKKKAVKERQAQSPGRFLAATLEELIIAINELPDGIILEVYFDGQL